jgi:AcrR family transcriptional regulator
MVAARPVPRRRYAGASAEERRDGRRARLLAAGLEVLGEDGCSGATVRGICARARLTPRYFYESFDDLDALLVAVFDEIVAQAGAVVLEALAAAPADAHARTEAAVGSFVRFVTDDPRRARIAFVEAQGSEPLTRRRFAAMRAFAEMMATQASDFYGFARDSDPLIDLTATLLVGGMAELLITWLDGGLDVDRDALVADLGELFVATGESAIAIARRRATR